jgi:rare lipoprotein A
MITRVRRKKFNKRLLVAAGLILLCFFWQKTRPIRFKFPLNGQASWYSRADPGINLTTANNEIFDDRDMTCAIWGVDFGTELKVINRENGRSVIVRVNDRGPHPRYVKQGRVIDLTKSAFQQIAPLNQGLVKVRIVKIKK